MIEWPVLIALLLFTGFVLLLVEIFVIPGFGPVGIAAILFLGIGSYFSWTKLSFFWGLGTTFASILAIVFSIVLLKKLGIADKLILGGNLPSKNRENSLWQGKKGDGSELNIMAGETGMTHSDLRPSGIAEFGNRRLNVIADGIYIRRNTRVKIIRIEGSKIFVEEEG